MPPSPRFWVSWFLLIGVLVPRGVFGFRGAWATAKKKKKSEKGWRTFTFSLLYVVSGGIPKSDRAIPMGV